MADKKSYSVSSMYEAKGEDVSRKNKECPKCGPGTYMGKHKNREACGKCGYTVKAN